MEPIHVKADMTVTIDMKADIVYEIEYTGSSVNIINYSDGALLISEINDFEKVDGVGKYLTITSGNIYNDYIFHKSGKNYLYAKADKAGQICLVKKNW